MNIEAFVIGALPVLILFGVMIYCLTKGERSKFPMK